MQPGGDPGPIERFWAFPGTPAFQKLRRLFTSGKYDPMEHGRTDRPHFEVLVVEDMTEHQEHALREELRRWRRPDDPFIYEIIVVPSLEDAIMAARLNFRLQASPARCSASRSWRSCAAWTPPEIHGYRPGPSQQGEEEDRGAPQHVRVTAGRQRLRHDPSLAAARGQ
jgi:hypothetical protein